MMNLAADFFTALLISYLAFTSLLADKIETWFINETLTPKIEIAKREPIYSIPSKISQSIPDILLKSSNYQQASISGAAGLAGATTDEPLEAIVNIFCTFSTDKYIRTTTGTGFFIDPDGVILTNAHVAQFLLLENTEDSGEAECIVRKGNPATPSYHAELLYISPAWIQENASVMNDATPMGTGERDYALLYVDRSIDNKPLPAKFPSLSLAADTLPVTAKNSKVTAAGYPATDLLKNGPDTDLIPRKASTTISELYTFGSNLADVFSIHGTTVGAEGSSGGPVTNSDGQVIGIIATRGDDTIDGKGSLRAITTAHVNRTILQETGFTLKENLNGNLPYRAQIFADTMTPFLIAILQQAR